jgi:hypothetical protein
VAGLRSGEGRGASPTVPTVALWQPLGDANDVSVQQLRLDHQPPLMLT